ncbi:ArsC/Spx/MgsR family protein [Calidifontibacter terrae]
MSDVTVLHNPRCSTSRAALDAAEGQDVEEVQYLKHPLTRAELLDLITKLEDEPADLVRRDPLFHQLGLADDDVRTPEQVADLLAEHPKLMQRPVLIRGDRAIIGRPKERVPAFLRGE